MAASEETVDEYLTIIRVISGWPMEKRVTLNHDILRTLVTTADERSKRDTWARAPGLLSCLRGAATDEEVDQLLDESHSQKHV